MKEKMSDSLLRYIDAGRPLIYINHFDFETVDRMLVEAFPKAGMPLRGIIRMRIDGL